MTQMQKRHFSRRIYDPGSVRRDLREILTHFDEFRAAVRSKRISKAFAERIMLAVSAVNGCRYCSYGHVRSALKYGVSSEEVDLLLRGEVGHVASDEVPALLFAQHYAESGGHPDPAMIQKLVMTYGPEKTDEILACDQPRQLERQHLRCSSQPSARVSSGGEQPCKRSDKPGTTGSRNAHHGSGRTGQQRQTQIRLHRGSESGCRGG